MITDDQVLKASGSVIAGVRVLLQAAMEGSQVAHQELLKMSLEFKSLCESARQKAD